MTGYLNDYSNNPGMTNTSDNNYLIHSSLGLEFTDSLKISINFKKVDEGIGLWANGIRLGLCDSNYKYYAALYLSVDTDSNPTVTTNAGVVGYLYSGGSGRLTDTTAYEISDTDWHTIEFEILNGTASLSVDDDVKSTSQEISGLANIDRFACTYSTAGDDVVDIATWDNTNYDMHFKFRRTDGSPDTWLEFRYDDLDIEGDIVECDKNLKIYYNNLTGVDFICCNCSRWDVQNYNIIFETWLKKSDLQTLRGNITPGATGELFKILGRPTYYDSTWTGNNTIKLVPSRDLEEMRNDTTLYVKSISDSPMEGDSGWLSVKIEGYLSGSGDI